MPKTSIWVAFISAFPPTRSKSPAASTIPARNHSAGAHPYLLKTIRNCEDRGEPKIRRLMGELQGDELIRAPKGFDPRIRPLRFIKKKDWILDAMLDPV